MARIQAKLKDGKRTEADLSNELRDFDTLLARHKTEQTEAVANILVQKASLYWQVLQNFEQASECIERLKRDFPRTKSGEQADKMLASISKHADAKRIQTAFAVGVVLPDFEGRDLKNTPLSLGRYKGKVVLLDFGAASSKAWLAEFPNLSRVYDTYHPEGFEIVGISLDADRLRHSGFTAQHKILWAQYCDGDAWDSKVAIQYGVNSLPCNYLLDRQGRILAKNLRGEALEQAAAKAVKQPSQP